MKRIIPVILIIVIFSCIVLPFSVSAWISSNLPDSSLFLKYNYGFTVYESTSYISVNPFTIYFAYAENARSASTGTQSFTVNYIQFHITNYEYQVDFCDRSSGNNQKIIRISNYINSSGYSHGLYYYRYLQQGIVCISYLGEENNYLSLFPYDSYDPNVTHYVGFYFDSSDLSYINSVLLQHSSLQFQPNVNTYTITFNSNGGSIIEPITDIEPDSTVNLDVTIGGITTYNPVFVPEREGYLFDYWYQIDYPLTPVHSITVNDDITLIAKWTRNSDYAQIYVGDYIYYDRNFQQPVPSTIYVRIGSNFEFYVNYTGNKVFRGKVDYTTNSGTKTYKGPSGVYKYSIPITDNGTIELQLLDWLNITASIYPDNTDVRNVISNVQLHIRGSVSSYELGTSFSCAPYSPFTISFDMRPPYVISTCQFIWSLYDSETVFPVTTVVESASDYYGFFTHVEVTYTPTRSGTLNIINKSITEYDDTSRTPIIVHDESGNAIWNFSEVEILDTDWSVVDENIPHRIDGLFDGLFSLAGLSILIPLVMTVSFAIWFIRRS